MINFSDETFHNTGVGFNTSERDLGRSEFTGNPEDRWKFKTPTLRGIMSTAPYMHDGSQETLYDVVEFYNRGGSPKDPHLTPDLVPLGLNEDEIDALVAFLEALSEE